MPAERDLATLCRSMSPTLHPATFVYCCLQDRRLPAGVEPVCTVAEREGLTVILPKAQATAAGLAHQFECAMVTLEVPSALDAVGFLAVVSAALARESIACNVVSAYHHDHLFVPYAARHRAMEVLVALSAA